MSLDVSLYLVESIELTTETEDAPKIFVRVNGQTKEVTQQEWDQMFPGCEAVTVQMKSEPSCVFDWNITHNLNKMAGEAGIYGHLWRPDEIEVTKAHQLIEPLQNGLLLLKSDPARFKAFNPSNGWGDYDGLVNFVEKYLQACEQYPDADISISR